MYRHCRECRAELGEYDHEEIGLCQEHIALCEDWRRYDDLREEGHNAYAAKLMAGLADPPDPDDD